MTFNDEKIYSILERLPSEEPCIDYKICPYEKGKQDYALVKDVIAMLNSEAGYGKDKYIIIGVVDKTHTRKGIDKASWRDDNEYQNLFDKIWPRPDISTGCVEYEGKIFGYIYIPASNNEQIYEAGETIVGLDEKDQQAKESTIIAKGQAFSRKGSVNYILMSADRERLRSKKIQPRDIIKTISSETSKRKNIMIALAFAGAWNEKSVPDQKIIEKLSKTDYSIYLDEIRNIYEQYPDLLKYVNGCWNLKDHKAFLLSEAGYIYEDHIELFFDALRTCTNDLNLKYDLPTESRPLASLLGKNRMYSGLLCHGLTETLAILGNAQESFDKCTKNSINNHIYCFERDFFTTTDWKKYASNADELEMIGEACPEVFLSELERLTTSQDKAFIQFLTEKKESYLSFQYGYQLHQILSNIAKTEKYFARAIEVLMNLAQIRPEFLETIVKIILPWFPQTHAPLSMRKGAIIAMAQENEDIAWEALMKLMPHVTITTNISDDPKYLQIEPIPRTITKKEANDAYIGYIHLACELMGVSIDRICSMISVIDDVDSVIEQEILGKIKEKVQILNEQDKATLWNTLLDFLHRHRRYADSEWALHEDRLVPVEEFANSLAPDSKALQSIRMFRNKQFLLREGKGNFAEEEKKRKDKQVEILQDIYKEGGLKDIRQFANKVENKRLAGNCACNVLNNADIRVLITSSSDICNDEFLRGIVRWLPYDRMQDIIKGLTDIVQAEIVAIMPICDISIQMIEKLSEESQDKYWNNVGEWGWSKKDFTCVEKAVQNLNKRNRIIMSLSILYDFIQEDEWPIRPELVAETLILFDGNGLSDGNNFYEIQEIIKWLQGQKSVRDEMVIVEWKFIELLRESEGYSPEALYDELASNPDHYIFVMKLLTGKERNSEWTQDVVSQMGQHAYTLLQGWKKIPGLDEAGVIDEEKLYSWFSKVEKQSAEIGIEKKAMFYFGRVLFYAPADEDGFFMDKRVAKYLQGDKEGNILSGYHSAAVSYRGIHTVDPTGETEFKIQKSFEEKAREAEKRGMFRFAEILRDVADLYYEEGMRNKESKEL